MFLGFVNIFQTVFGLISSGFSVFANFLVTGGRILTSGVTSVFSYVPVVVGISASLTIFIGVVKFIWHY